MPTTFTGTLFSLAVLCIGLINIIHKFKYYRLMQHLKRNQPDIYEQIRIKRIFGPFYANGAYKPSFDYAKNHPPLDDPVAEELLADYAQFGQLTTGFFYYSYCFWYCNCYYRTYLKETL